MNNTTHPTQAQKLAYEMMTEGTGSHMLDSGGTNGRSWQRNQQKTIEQMIAEPSATLEIYGTDELIPTVNVFHVLANYKTNDICKAYNKLDCNEWSGDHHGTSAEQCEWLESNGFESMGEAWNTYNWENNFSQVLQGQTFRRETETGEEFYNLIQLHNGADVRGGYTDARLFFAGDYEECTTYMLMDDCGFCADNKTSEGEYISLDWSGEWVTSGGGCPDDEYLETFVTLSGYVSDSITLAGDYNPSEF